MALIPGADEALGTAGVGSTTFSSCVPTSVVGTVAVFVLGTSAALMLSVVPLACSGAIAGVAAGGAAVTGAAVSSVACLCQLYRSVSA